MPTSTTNHYLIGLGGGGCWEYLALTKTLQEKDTLILIDKDKIEAKNLDRQMFTNFDTGKFKVEAISNRYRHHKCKVIVFPDWLTLNTELEAHPLLFCCADNHPARLACLMLADKYEGYTIIAGNEYTDAEAYYYQHNWKDTRLDPRVYYPELITDHSNDPTRPCTGEAMEAAPQLAISNMMAASYSMWLYWFWFHKRPELNGNENWYPVKVNNNFSGIESFDMEAMNREVA